MPKGVRKPVNHFVICLDRSGSMQGIARQAVDMFNQNVTAIREGAKSTNQHTTVSLVTFGRGGVKEHFLTQDVEQLKPLEYSEYHADGQTPLLDAVGLTVDKLAARKDARYKHVSYMFIVITDGEENDSRAYHNPEEFRATLNKVQATDRWSFAFLLPPSHAAQFGRQFGIPDGNIKAWDATRQGAVKVAAQSISDGVGVYFQARSVGQSSVRGFFTTDLSKVDSKAVKKQLDDIKDKVVVLTVAKEAKIQPFVEEKVGQYVRGNAYYQLMKDEKVQAYKQVILVDKGNGAVYGGEEARKLLGLPDAEVKVRPGNHSNWDIFVQSTSLNRILPRGTKLVYVK